MQLDILTPEGKVFSGKVDSVILPGSLGQFQILKNHAPLIASLKEGVVKIKEQKTETSFNIKKGVCEVISNHVSILTEGVTE